MRQKCLVLAYAVHETGRREVLGLDVGECETEPFGASCSAAYAPAGCTAFAPASLTPTPG